MEMIPSFQEPTKYEICVKGHLDRKWASWFEGMSITSDFKNSGVPVTVLCGPIADQAALHGIIAKIRDIGIPVISINLVDFGE